MKSVHFSIANIGSLRLDMPDNVAFGRRELMLAQAYVPGLTKLDSEQQSERHSRLRLVESNYACLIHLHADYVQYENNFGDGLPLDTFMLMYSIVRFTYLECRMFPTHSACVTNGNRTMLLVGHSGHGKTTVSCKLLQDYGYRLISGNKTVIVSRDGNRMKAIAGTSTVTHHIDDADPTERIHQPGFRYGNRYAAQLKPEFCQNPPALIDDIVILKLNDHSSRCEQLPPHVSIHRLYPFFMDVVNGDVVLDDGFYHSEPHGSRGDLVHTLGQTLPQVRVWDISGSLKFIMSQLEER